LEEDLGAPPRKGRAALFVAIPLAVVVVFLSAVLVTRADDRPNPLVGLAAPAIDGTTLDGEPFDLDSLRGQWVVVNFFATWCVPCRVEHPELESFDRRHRQAGDAAVISVVFGDEPSEVAEFFEQNGGEWPVVAGDEGRIALEYSVTGVPESFLVDPTGVVHAHITGGVTSTGLDRLLDERKAVFASSLEDAT
jgi:cytochrome c biogenesis protein CcmG/thiol:disulfide interchange protein DsbE